jgi:inosine triphosphate pyrophosphatase
LDISIAMAYAMLSTYGKDNRSLSAAAGILRGYNAVYRLTPLERKHLVLLVACRLACSCTLGAYSIQQNPANKYLLLHAEPAWKALEMIWCYDPDQRDQLAIAADRLFNQACMYDDPRPAILTCYDLVVPDPGIADLLQSVRVSSFEVVEPPPKKHKLNKDGVPIITFVTGNAKKLEEVKRILGTDTEDSNMPFHLTNMKVDLPELQGDPITIAKEKCKVAASELQGAVITEDTSLCFNALNGLPGPYIKWFLEKCGHDGLNKMIEAFTDKTGYAQTIVAFCPGPGKEPAIFDGRTSGSIVMPRGKLDFGWDPIFQPDEGGGKTYAEMNKEDKDAISHRSRAFGQLKAYLFDERATIQSEMERS